MKKLFLVMLLLNLAVGALCQVYPSYCVVHPSLRQAYQWDVKNLTVRRMNAINSPAINLVKIPQAWQDTIWEGLAAIANATAMPQRDSVFNMYCVHDSVFDNFTVNWEYMVFVDTSYTWTQAWQNMVTLTGNPLMDTILTRYHLIIKHFYFWSFGCMGLLKTDSLWNSLALSDSLELVPGVNYVDPNGLIGTRGKIVYKKAGSDRFYDLSFQWNDCFDGCDNSRTWKFKVNPDCSVQFLGIVDWGVFGIEPLPPPINCNILTLIPTPERQMHLYPNPAGDEIMVQAPWPDDYGLQVFNSGGMLVYESRCSGDHKIPLQMVPAGIYQVRLTGKSTTASGRFIRL